MTYFVYVETQFVQGYWKDASNVYESGDKFLYPYSYTDLFGTVKKDFYNKLLERLGEYHDFYSAVSLDSNKLKREGYREFYDTLNFAVQTELTAEQIKTVKNELTTTVLSAGECQAIRLRFYQNGELHNSKVYDYSDLDYPVFDLVSMNKGRPPVTRIVKVHVRDTVYQTSTDTVVQQKAKDPQEEEGKGKEITGRQSCWDRYLWLGIIAVLGILLVRERRRSKK
ncbi:MAG: hypothetical protein ACLFM7_06560 [Bacteroidales bacterium]